MSSKEITNCPACFKCFKKKGCYEKHILYCDRELFMKPISEVSKIPTNAQLLEMITTLTDKYNSVQKELQAIKNQIYTKNKKIDVLNWLNDHNTCDVEHTHSFLELMNNIPISVEDLNVIFETNFVNGVFELINKHISSNGNIDLVVKCFNQKKNILYVYEKDKWVILENDNFMNVMKQVNVKIFDAFKQYRDLNSDKLDSDQYQVQYNSNLKKIMCVHIPFDAKCTRIRNKLYTENKQCIKSITEIQLV